MIYKTYYTVIIFITKDNKTIYRQKEELGEALLPSKYFTNYAKRKIGNYNAALKRFGSLYFADIYGDKQLITPTNLKEIRVAQLEKEVAENGSVKGRLFLYDTNHKQVVEELELVYEV